MIFKKEDQFSIHLRNMSANLMESTRYFADYKITNGQDLKEFANQMKFYETEGDTIVHQIIHELNKVFITPIEREDILALATHMEDRKSTRLNSSHVAISYAVFCLKKKTKKE